MSDKDIYGLVLLCAVTVIALGELALTAWVALAPVPVPDEPHRERPSSLPKFRDEDAA